RNDEIGVAFGHRLEAGPTDGVLVGREEIVERGRALILPQREGLGRPVKRGAHGYEAGLRLRWQHGRWHPIRSMCWARGVVPVLAQVSPAHYTAPDGGLAVDEVAAMIALRNEREPHLDAALAQRDCPGSSLSPNRNRYCLG